MPASHMHVPGAAGGPAGARIQPDGAVSADDAVAALVYDTFDPTPCDFPAPCVPVLPALTFDGLFGGMRSEFAPIGAGQARRRYTHGRYALYEAYRLAGVGHAGALLAPAYHCRTMIDPAVALGAPIVLYGMSTGLGVDVAALKQLVERSVAPVRALLLTHYFGFAQPLAPVREFCDARGIALIEDCAHAMFTSRRAPQLGVSGRYVIASPYKMFPCDEGGLLLAAPGAHLPPTRAASLRREARVLVHVMQRRRAQRVARRRVAVDHLDTDIAQLAGRPIEPGRQTRARLEETSPMYDASEEGQACPRVATLIARLCNIEHIARRRRANYRRWSDAMQGLSHCRPLFRDLPDDCVPYMFPLVIDRPQTHFYLLKKLGVPIWRWDDMAQSSCALSQHYREHLLHLPCHQSLGEEELTWMTSAVAKVMQL